MENQEPITITLGDKSYNLDDIKPELRELIFCIQKADARVAVMRGSTHIPSKK